MRIADGWRPFLFGMLGMVAIGVLPARAMDITINYPAIERAVWQTVLTEGGRTYFEGGPRSPCQYAFIQQPRVSGLGGRLRFRFLFSGRAGKEVLGRCVGPGDTFDIVVSGVPALIGDSLVLASLRVEAPDTPYFRLVAGMVEDQVRQRLRYPLRPELDRLAGETAALGVAVSVEDLRMTQVQIDPDALRFRLELSLAVH